MDTQASCKPIHTYGNVLKNLPVTGSLIREQGAPLKSLFFSPGSSNTSSGLKQLWRIVTTILKKSEISVFHDTIMIFYFLFSTVTVTVTVRQMRHKRHFTDPNPHPLALTELDLDQQKSWDKNPSWYLE